MEYRPEIRLQLLEQFMVVVLVFSLIFVIKDVQHARKDNLFIVYLFSLINQSLFKILGRCFALIFVKKLFIYFY